MLKSREVRRERLRPRALQSVLQYSDLVKGVPGFFGPTAHRGAAREDVVRSGRVAGVAVALREIEHVARVVGMLLERLFEKERVTPVLFARVDVSRAVGGALHEQLLD